MAEILQARATPAAQKSAGEPEEVVLKRLLPTFRNDAGYVQQFLDEAKLTGRLRHPHIVRTFRAFKAGDDYLMVQELVRGRTVAFMQEALAGVKARMPPAASVYIALCVLKALDYLHRPKGPDALPAVHRDVNPANVLLSVGGDVKLCDFGVAEVEGGPRGEAGAMRGTLAYMSPEQVMGQPVDARSDLFSVGVLLWELLAGARLFEGEGDLQVAHKVRDARAPLLSRVAPELPRYAGQVVRKALFADKRLRFSSAAEFAKALELLAMRNKWPMTPDALKPLLDG